MLKMSHTNDTNDCNVTNPPRIRTTNNMELISMFQLIVLVLWSHLSEKLQAGSWCMWTLCRAVGPCHREHLSVCCVSVLLVVASESPADASK